jgi:outer membrane lipoprotein-sorting protein
MLKLISGFFCAALLFISTPVSVRAADMSVYSADIVTESSSGTHKSHMDVKGKKQRMETSEQGQKAINIIRGDKKVMWMIMPDEKMYMEMPLTRQKEDITSRMSDPDVKMEKNFLADEKVDGHPTKRYHVTMTRGGKKESSGFMWEAQDLNNFPVRWQEENKKTTVTWKNIELGDVPDSRFEVPAGYQKMGMPGMPNMPGMGFPGQIR